jgi:GNAT superfamily N-acetyltransferase
VSRVSDTPYILRVATLSLVIRPATAADAAAIAWVHVETWRAAYDGILPREFLAALSVPAAESRWADRLAGDDPGTYVSGDPVDGFACAGPVRDADVPASYGEVYALYVHPTAQRAGAGAALLAAAEGWLAGRGCRDAVLWTLTANAAGRAFYRARDWREDGTERTIDVGGTLADEVRFHKELSGRPATQRAVGR